MTSIERTISGKANIIRRKTLEFFEKETLNKLEEFYLTQKKPTIEELKLYCLYKISKK